jgi:hypothetical protein
MRVPEARGGGEGSEYSKSSRTPWQREMRQRLTGCNGPAPLHPRSF